MEQLLAFGLHIFCYVLVMLSLNIFYITVRRYITEESVPKKWFLLSCIFVPVFVGSILYTKKQIKPAPIDWGAIDTYIGLGLCVLLCLLSFFILSNMYEFTVYAFVKGVDPLEKKNWKRKGIFFTCYLDKPQNEDLQSWDD